MAISPLYDFLYSENNAIKAAKKEKKENKLYRAYDTRLL